MVEGSPSTGWREVAYWMNVDPDPDETFVEGEDARL